MMPAVLRQERGMALLLVLVVVALLAALLTEFAFSTLVDLRLTESFRDSSRAYYLARGGVQAGRMFVQSDNTSYDAHDELWAQGLSNYPVGGGVLTVAISDLDGKLAINALVDQFDSPVVAQRDRFIRLFQHLGFDRPHEMVAALVDWLDANDATVEFEGAVGAESDYYLGSTPPYQARNGRLATLEELALVRDFSTEIVERLRPHVAVHGGLAINLNTASAEVIASLNINEDQPIFLDEAEAVVAARAQTPFRRLKEFQEQFPALAVKLPTSSQLSYRVRVTSDYYQIGGFAWVNDGTSTVTAVIRKSDKSTLYLRVD